MGQPSSEQIIRRDHIAGRMSATVQTEVRRISILCLVVCADTMSFPTRQHVLVVSRDDRLLSTRTLILARLYETTGLADVSEMETLPPESRFDLVLLCHTLAPEDCEYASKMIRERWPRAKIVVLVSGQTGCLSPAADRTLSGGDGPRVLLQTIDQLLSSRADGPKFFGSGEKRVPLA